MKKLILFIFCYSLSLGSVVEGDGKVIGAFGAESCPWSEQLRKEVWDEPIFQDMLTSAGLVTEERRGTSKELETPVMILVSSEGEEIGRLGFLMIPPDKYVTLFKEMLSIHQLRHTLEQFPVSQLLQFYRKCQVLNMKGCEEKILQVGLLQDTGVDFLLEHYAKNCKTHPRKAQKIKSEIRVRKPASPEVEWQLALLSFHAKNEMHFDAEQVVKPLEKYLHYYGAHNIESRWRCHLILAEFYKEKKLPAKVRYHVDQAVLDAPEEVKEMLVKGYL